MIKFADAKTRHTSREPSPGARAIVPDRGVMIPTAAGLPAQSAGSSAMACTPQRRTPCGVVPVVGTTAPTAQNPGPIWSSTPAGKRGATAGTMLCNGTGFASWNCTALPCASALALVPPVWSSRTACGPSASRTVKIGKPHCNHGVASALLLSKLASKHAAIIRELRKRGAGARAMTRKAW